MKEKQLEFIRGEFGTTLPLPYADGGIRAGFPSPAQDYVAGSLDFNRELIRHPAATFYARVVGLSMIAAGIDEGDIIVVDRSLEPRHNDIVVAWVDGDFTLKYLDLTQKPNGKIILRPGNNDFPPICINDGDNCEIWGVVSKVIKNLR